MLAGPAAGLAPDAAEFVAEVKWDGLRACVAVAGERVRAWFRNGRDITAVYPALDALAAVAGRRTLVLDGEIVALSGPRPDFTVLQRRMHASRPGAGLLAAVPVTLIIFDVLRSGREDLAGRPCVLRRALLEDLGLLVPGSVQVPPAFPGDADALLGVTRAQDLEGIVLKRPASLYHPGQDPVTYTALTRPDHRARLGSALPRAHFRWVIFRSDEKLEPTACGKSVSGSGGPWRSLRRTVLLLPIGVGRACIDA
jgi:bifunctional non-homologous end joining protein LigD